MRNLSGALLAIGLLINGTTLANAECNTLASLQWMLGDWTAESKASSFQESWRALGPKSWEGQGIETSKADPARSSAEELRLVEMSEGVFYIAKVSHNALPVAFRLEECRDGRFIFANPAHDFPRRLEYVQGEGDRLQVRVSDGADKGFTLDFARSQVPVSAKDAVLAAEDARFAAMIEADPDAVRRALADELAYIHASGRVEDREQLIDSITSGRLRYLAIEPREREVMFAGTEGAFVHGLARIDVMSGPNHLDFQARYLAVYGLTDGVWKLRAWQSLRLP